MKISPLTNHRNTKKGAIKGVFDRVTLFENVEKGFDKLFGYDRQLTETFEYRNTMKHGIVTDKLQIQERELVATDIQPNIQPFSHTQLNVDSNILKFEIVTDKTANLFVEDNIDSKINNCRLRHRIRRTFRKTCCFSKKLFNHLKACNYSGTIRNLNIRHTFQSAKNILPIFDSSFNNRANPGKSFSTFSLSVTELP